jgi:hypothetical protein
VWCVPVVVFDKNAQSVRQTDRQAEQQQQQQQDVGNKKKTKKKRSKRKEIGWMGVIGTNFVSEGQRLSRIFCLINCHPLLFSFLFCDLALGFHGFGFLLSIAAAAEAKEHQGLLSDSLAHRPCK